MRKRIGKGKGKVYTVMELSRTLSAYHLIVGCKIIERLTASQISQPLPLIIKRSELR